MAELRKRYDSLTRREQEVMTFVAGGLANKQIAAEMNIGESTVKPYLGRLMQKRGAESLADLVSVADNVDNFSKA